MPTERLPIRVRPIRHTRACFGPTRHVAFATRHLSHPICHSTHLSHHTCFGHNSFVTPPKKMIRNTTSVTPHLPLDTFVTPQICHAPFVIPHVSLAFCFVAGERNGSRGGKRKQEGRESIATVGGEGAMETGGGAMEMMKVVG